jgi:hypothetical protein
MLLALTSDPQSSKTSGGMSSRVWLGSIRRYTCAELKSSTWNHTSSGWQQQQTKKTKRECNAMRVPHEVLYNRSRMFEKTWDRKKMEEGKPSSAH